MGGPELDKIEKLLYDFTKLCPNIRDLSYADRLKAMRLTSIERRFDQYRILYVRKCLLNLVPNCGITVARKAGERNGLKVWILNKKYTSCLRNRSFTVRGPELFNSLPKDLRNYEGSMDSFKNHLDSFLELIEDSPRMGLCSLVHNSLDWTWRLGTQVQCINPEG